MKYTAEFTRGEVEKKKKKKKKKKKTNKAHNYIKFGSASLLHSILSTLSALVPVGKARAQKMLHKW